MANRHAIVFGDAIIVYEGVLFPTPFVPEQFCHERGFIWIPEVHDSIRRISWLFIIFRGIMRIVQTQGSMIETLKGAPSWAFWTAFVVNTHYALDVLFFGPP